MDRDSASALIRDPQADPGLLAQVAHDHPDLRAAVANHPAAYDGLLEWLGTLGDPAVDLVLAARAGTPPPSAAAVPPPPPAPPGASSVPAAPATPGTPPPAGSPGGGIKVSRRTLAVVGGIVVLALAAGGAALALQGLGGTASTGTTTLLASYPDKPSETWEVSTRDFTRVDTTIYGVGYTPKHFVVRSASDDDGRVVVAGYDLAARELAWDVEFRNSLATCRAVDTAPSVFCATDNELVILDAATGEETGTVRYRSGDYSTMVTHKNGAVSVLLVDRDSSDARAQVVHADKTGTELWSAEIESRDEVWSWSMTEGLSDGEVIVSHEDYNERVTSWAVRDEEPESLRTGDTRSTYVGSYRVENRSRDGEALDATVYDADDKRVLRVNDSFIVSSSVADWSSSQPVIARNHDRGEITAWDLKSGEEKWSYRLRDGGSVSLVLPAVVLVTDGDNVIALNRSDGEELWQERRGDRFDFRTDGTRVIAYDGRDLQAFDLRTGELVWRDAALRSGDTSYYLYSSGDRLVLEGRDTFTFYEP